MSDIKVRGFVNKGSVKEGSKGKFSTFTLAEGQKQKDGTYTNAYFNVTNFDSPEPPPDGSRVEVTGYMKVRSYEGKNGPGTSLDITAKGIEELSPANGKAAEEDPFGL